MALTIEQIQSSINARSLDARQLINIIVDYLQANPPGAGGAAGYLVYTALLSQVGTSAPTAIVLQNTLGGTVVWTYDAPGSYIGTLAGAFPEDKTFFSITSVNAEGKHITAGNNNMPDSISIAAYDIATDAIVNGALNFCSLEIRVYP